jgi:hypothetical protein
MNKRKRIIPTRKQNLTTMTKTSISSLKNEELSSVVDVFWRTGRETATTTPNARNGGDDALYEQRKVYTKLLNT